MAYVEDRWMDNEGNRKPRYGKGSRYRVMDRIGGKLSSLGNYGDLGQALARKQEVEDTIGKGLTPDAKQPRDITLGWVLAAFEAHPVRVSRPSIPPAKGTVTQYLSNGQTIVDILGADLSLPELTRLSVTKIPELVEALKAKGTLGPRSINSHLKLVSTFYKLGSHYGKLPTEIPAPSLTKYHLTVPKQEKIAFSPSDVHTLIANAPKDFRAFLMLAAFTGMRVSEIRGLQKNHVSVTKKIVLVRQQGGTTSESLMELKTTEQGKRDLHIPTTVTVELQKHIASTKDARDKRPDLNLIFPTRSGTVQSAANVTNRGWIPSKRNAAIATLKEALGEFAEAEMLMAANEAKETARAEAKASGKKVGAIIDAGHKAYADAQIQYMSERLDDDHPAHDSVHLFEVADFHHLRRSFATQLFIETGNIVQVAAALGDSVQTVLNTYIVESPETVERIKAATEKLYQENTDGALIEVDTDMANVLIPHLKKNLEEQEAEIAKTEGEVQDLTQSVSELEKALGDIGILSTETEALRALTRALEGSGTISDLLQNLDPVFKDHPSVKKLLDDKVAEEDRERLEYERLRAKFGE